MARLGFISIVLAVTAAAVAQAAPAPNVRGTLDQSTYQPRCYPDEPCDTPPAGAYLAFMRGGKAVARTRVKSSGKFAVYLPPATYWVRVAPPVKGVTVTPARIVVPAGKTVTLKLRLRSTAPPPPSAVP